MRLARAMKRKAEKSAAVGELRAVKGFARAKKTVYHATTEEIVRCKKVRKETETTSMIIMDVAVNRVFGWARRMPCVCGRRCTLTWSASSGSM